MSDAPPASQRLGRLARWAWLLLPVHLLALAVAFRAPGLVEASYGRAVYPLLTWLRLPLDRTPLSPALTVLGGLALWVAWAARGGAPAPADPPRWRRVLTRAALALALVAHGFAPGWGLNYARPALAERLGLVVDPAPSQRAFAATAGRVVAATNAARLPWPASSPAELEAAVDLAVRELLTQLGADEAAFPRRTRLMPRGLFLTGGWHGVTIPWTTEAWGGPGGGPRWLPHVLAHEKAHQAGFAREADANLVAWLALVRAPDPRLRYSTLCYVVDLFLEASPVALEQGVARELEQAGQAEQAAQVPQVAAATQSAYEAYLQANQVQAGLQDYDRVALLIHAWLQAHPDELPP